MNDASNFKYDRGRVRGPGWQEADQVLADTATDPARARGQLTRLLAAAIGLGHADLHRRNAGLQHDLKAPEPCIGLAPVYDVSSGSAVRSQITFDLPFGIAGNQRFDAIGPVQWLTHAKNTGQDPDVVIATVNEILRDLPEAIANARDRARTEDENIDQDAVDNRVEDLLRWAARRKRGWETMLGQARAKQARGLEPASSELGAQIRCLDEARGDPTPIVVVVQDNGPMVVELDTDDDTPKQEYPITELRTLARALVEAGRYAPEDLPGLNAELERDRRVATTGDERRDVNRDTEREQPTKRPTGAPDFRTAKDRKQSRSNPTPQPSITADFGR